MTTLHHRPHRRRTQAERTAATRTRLLDATVQVLAKRGFAKTSTTAIARKAGVSRGAQLHHFPTKIELVVAAIDHLFERRKTEFRARFEALPSDQRTQTAAIDLLWEIFQSPDHDAVNELIVAARTDRILRPVAADVLAQFNADVAAIFADLFGISDDDSAAQQTAVALALLHEAAVHRGLGLDDRAELLVQTLKDLSQLITAIESGPPVTALPTSKETVA